MSLTASWSMSRCGGAALSASLERLGFESDGDEETAPPRTEVASSPPPTTTPRSSRKKLVFSEPRPEKGGGGGGGGISASSFYSGSGSAPQPDRRCRGSALSRLIVKASRRHAPRARRSLESLLVARGGVRHSIRKPRNANRRGSETAAKRALEKALRLIDDSPLNEYILKAIEPVRKIVEAPLKAPPAPKFAPAARRELSDDDELEEFPRPPRKFFKSERGRRARASPPKKPRVEVEDDARFASESGAVEKLLDQWEDEEVPEDEAPIDDERHRDALHNAEALLRNETQEDDDDEAIMLLDEGYILLRDDINDPIDNVENIDSELESIDRRITEIAKNNNLNPDIFLQPENCSETPPSSIVTENRMPRSPRKSPRKALFPLFNRNSNAQDSESGNDARTQKPVESRKKFLSSDDNQYFLDAGQKKFGATQCKDCNIVYQIGNAGDETNHMIHHDGLDILKFNGWKNERFCGRWGEGRAIVINPDDPRSHWQRVHDLLDRIVHPQLGFAAPLKPEKRYKAFLFVEKKLIVGCIIAEPLQEAHKLIVHNDVDCCSRRAYPVKCGVSRLWTHVSHRNAGIATKLMNAMRTNFMFGHILACEEIAFSAPTPLGKSFIEKYCQTSSFNVYVD